MKNIPTWIKIIVLLGAIIASKFLFFSGKQDKSAASADKKNMPVSVNYIVVTSDTLKHVLNTTGRIGAFNQVELMPEVNGKITAINFKEGQTVSKGAVLIKLNDADLQAQVLKNKNQQHLAEQKLQRLKKLLSISGVSQEEYDMQANELESLKADEAYLKAQIDKTQLIAPFEGVLGLKDISEGSYVSPAKAVVSLVQLKPLFVEFSVPEKYAHLVKKGLAISFSSAIAGISHGFAAEVYAVEPKVDDLTKTIKARAAYTGSEVFYPGSFVKVKLDFGRSDKAVLIPNTCVIGTLKGQKVFVSRNQVATEVPVEIGFRNENNIEITSGLAVGDTVISTGLLSLRKDTKLTLLKAGN